MTVQNYNGKGVGGKSQEDIKKDEYEKLMEVIREHEKGGK